MIYSLDCWFEEFTFWCFIKQNSLSDCNWWFTFDMDLLLMIWWKCSVVLFTIQWFTMLIRLNGLTTATKINFNALRFPSFFRWKRIEQFNHGLSGIWLSLFLFQTMFKFNQKCLVKQKRFLFNFIFDFNHLLKTLLTPLSQNYKPLNVVQ